MLYLIAIFSRLLILRVFLIPILLWTLSFGSVSQMWQSYRSDQLAIAHQLARCKEREKRAALIQQQSFLWIDRCERRKTPPKKGKVLQKKGDKTNTQRSMGQKNPEVIFEKAILTHSAGIPSAARLDLLSAVNSCNGQKILASLIKDLYKDQPFFQRCIKRQSNFVELLIAELRKEAQRLIELLVRQSPSNVNLIDTDWSMLLLRNGKWQQPFQKMLIGGPDYPSLRLFISLNFDPVKISAKKRLAPIYLQHALPPLQKALLGPEIFDGFQVSCREFSRSAACNMQKEREQKIPWLLPSRFAMRRKACAFLIEDLLKKRGMDMRDMPGKGALRLHAHCPQSRELILAKENGGCLTLKVEPTT